MILHCSVENCKRPHQAKGFCELHYRRFKKHGTPFKEEKKCSVEGCTSPHFSKGFCKSHYRCNRRYGTPFSPHKREKKEKCSVENCNKSVYARGFCQPHYKMKLKYGSLPLTVEKRTYLTKEQIIDIRKRRKGGEKLEALAADFKCCHTTIWKKTVDIPPPPQYRRKESLNRKMLGL